MGLYSEGLVIGRIFASKIWGAYFWEGYRNFTIQCQIGQNRVVNAYYVFSCTYNTLYCLKLMLSQEKKT